MIKSIALIGGGGFIGTNLANFFIERNYKVLVVGRSAIDKKRFVSDAVNTLLIDVNHTSKLIAAIEEYENVVWLVNNLLPSLKMDSLVDDFNLNVNPLIKLLELSKESKYMKRFIFLSSGGTIYGDSPNRKPFTESCFTQPISAYGMSKIISENYVEYITRKSSFDSYVLRPSNVYGNFQNLLKPQGIVGYTFDAALNNKSINLFGNGEVTRDFIHVLDLASAIECCVNNRYAGAQVVKYNIGSGEGCKIRDVVDLVNKISKKYINTIPQPLREFDCVYNVLDISKIKIDLGWIPNIDMDDGLESVWKWMSVEQGKK